MHQSYNRLFVGINMNSENNQILFPDFQETFTLNVSPIQMEELEWPFEQAKNCSMYFDNIDYHYVPQQNSEFDFRAPLQAKFTDSQIGQPSTLKKTKKISDKKKNDGVKHKKNKQSKRIGKTPKNDTKNIPKNFGKAIIAFILKKQISVEKILAHHKVEYESLSAELGQMKKKVNTIADLRKLWTEHKEAKCLRALSDLFFRRYSMHYIFNSRVWNYKSHIKYRSRMREALNCPEGFNYIKEF